MFKDQKISFALNILFALVHEENCERMFSDYIFFRRQCTLHYPINSMTAFQRIKLISFLLTLIIDYNDTLKKNPCHTSCYETI